MSQDTTGSQEVAPPLWTARSFVAAYDMLKDAGMDRNEAISNLVATMVRQYEAERQRQAAEIASLTAKLAAANATIMGLDKEDEA